MGTTREELEGWLNGVADVTTSSADLGSVVDNLYEERKIVVHPYLGITDDELEDTVEVEFAGSGIEEDIDNMIQERIATYISNSEVEEV